MAATHVRPEDINFMITHARGLVCLTITLTGEQLNLPLMSDKMALNLAPTLRYRLKRQKGHHRYLSSRSRQNHPNSGVIDCQTRRHRTTGTCIPIVAQNGGVLHRAGSY